MIKKKFFFLVLCMFISPCSASQIMMKMTNVGISKGMALGYKKIEQDREFLIYLTCLGAITFWSAAKIQKTSYGQRCVKNDCCNH